MNKSIELEIYALKANLPGRNKEVFYQKVNRSLKVHLGESPADIKLECFKRIELISPVAMKKRTINIIIILMSIALIGTAVVQSFWIRQSVIDLEKRFDDNVYRVLQNATEYLEREKKKIEEEEAKDISIFSQTNAYGFTREEVNSGEFRATKNYVNRLSLENLIDKEALYDFIKKEMVSLGITAEYHYCIFSLKNQNCVITDDYYNIEVKPNNNSSPAFVDPPKELDFHDKNTYERGFFGTLKQPRFEIRMYFPNRRQFIWKKALPFMLLVFLFLLLILACFIYTIWEILRQKKVSEMKTDFINNMTHEFKTPIATISLATDSITSKKVIESPDRIKRFAQIIKQENGRMLSQVEKVLQMALIDKSNFELKIADLDLNEIITQAVGDSRLKVEKRGGTVELKLDAENHIIEGDRTHIMNMIYNLLDNANKYTPQEPKIIVSTANKPNGVAVSIEDNGIGMSSDAKKHIFDKFYRVHTGNLHDVKGFGLGLSYVKSLMTAHKGQITVKSELNKGSKFTLFFPFKQNPA